MVWGGKIILKLIFNLWETLDDLPWGSLFCDVLLTFSNKSSVICRQRQFAGSMDLLYILGCWKLCLAPMTSVDEAESGEFSRT